MDLGSGCYWRIIQKASGSRDEIKRNGIDLIKAITEHGISDAWLDELRLLGAGLSPGDRRRLIAVVRGLRHIRESLGQELGDGGRAAHFWLLSLRTMLSHFERDLRNFDSEMASQFDRFTKSPIDNRELSEHVEPLVVEFEKTGNIN